MNYYKCVVEVARGLNDPRPKKETVRKRLEGMVRVAEIKYRRHFAINDAEFNKAFAEFSKANCSKYLVAMR